MITAEIFNNKQVISDVLGLLQDWNSSINLSENMPLYTKGYVSRIQKDFKDKVFQVGDTLTIEDTRKAVEDALEDVKGLLSIYDPSKTEEVKELTDFRDDLQSRLNRYIEGKMVIIDEDTPDGIEVVIRGDKGEYVKGTLNTHIFAGHSRRCVDISIEDTKIVTGGISTYKQRINVEPGTWMELYVEPNLGNLFKNTSIMSKITLEEERWLRDEEGIIGDIINYNAVQEMKRFGYTEDFIQGIIENK